MPNILQPMHDIWVVTAGTVVLDAAAEYACCIFRPIPGKTITHISAYCTASTSGVVDAKLETVTGAVPSGTLAAAGAELTSQSVSANTWYDFALGTPYTVPTGASTMLAGVIRYVSGTTTTWRTRWGGKTIDNPRIVENPTGVTQRNSYPSITITYSDGTVHPEMFGVISNTASSYNSGSNPDEYGNRFVPEFNMKAAGIAFSARVATGCSMRFRIYDSDLNVLTTDNENTFGVEIISGLTALQTAHYCFASPLPLIAGRTYYITQTAMNGNSIYQCNVTWASEAHKNAFHGTMSLATRQNDTGAFTIDDTKTEMLVPIIDTGYGLMRLCNNGGFCG